MMEEFSEYIVIGIGVALSTLGFFLRKEHGRLTKVEEHLNEVHLVLAKNETRDEERWADLSKSITRIETELEKRRQSEIKLFDLVQARKK